MAKQKLNKKKLNICRTYGGRNYQTAYVRGGWEHFWAECWFQKDADMVNYKTKEYYPIIRNGKILVVPDSEIEFWNGEKNRPLQVCRPCPCGCDDRDGIKGIGYLTGSNQVGAGFTIWFASEKSFQKVQGILNA